MRKFMEVKKEFKKTTSDKVLLPVRATKKSCAYDFYAQQDYVCLPDTVTKIWSDVKCCMEDDDRLDINIRSSMGGIFELSNTIGYIDADYFENKKNDGNIGLFLRNVSNQIQYIKKGDRIAQGTFSKYLITDDDCPLSEERVGGFGSTNK